MNLIDRYVYAVAQYLPKDIGDDVTKELRTNIEDMLPENYTEEDAYKVLEELGSPLELANEYHPRKRYLIGPGYYDSYISVLKLVVGIFFAVFTGIALIGSLVNPSEMDLVGMIVGQITNIISGAFAGVVQGAFWVTLVFIILERSGAETGHLPFISKEWTPDSLPEIPVNELNRASRGAIVFSMICTIAFTAFLYLQPQLIGIYTKGENGVINTTTLFDTNRLKGYMFFIIALAVYQLGTLVWMYIAERWNMPLVICKAIHNVLACVLAVVMISDRALFNARFVPAMADHIKASADTISIWFDRGKMIFAGFFIVITIWDSLARYCKYRAGSKAVHAV